eukprot:1145836-Pelagomonas_calceolata.AAC.30
MVPVTNLSELENKTYQSVTACQWLQWGLTFKVYKDKAFSQEVRLLACSKKAINSCRKLSLSKKEGLLFEKGS